MSKQKLKDNEEIIIAMQEAGKSRQEIADKLGILALNIMTSEHLLARDVIIQSMH